MGQLLRFRGEGTDAASACNAFYHWLEEINVSATASDIVSPPPLTCRPPPFPPPPLPAFPPQVPSQGGVRHRITRSIAEKTNMHLPTFGYDPAHYQKA